MVKFAASLMCANYLNIAEDIRKLGNVDIVLALAQTEEQAEEIIAYLEKRGEVERPYAEKLRKQLKEKGVRSFGPKKEKDYYLKHGEF